jgi:hypothetical protein
MKQHDHPTTADGGWRLEEIVRDMRPGEIVVALMKCKKRGRC